MAFREDHPLVLAMKGWDDVKPTSKCLHCRGTGQAPGTGSECGFCEKDLQAEITNIIWVCGGGNKMECEVMAELIIEAIERKATQP